MAVVDDGRAIPLARLYLANKGQGDPILIDRGFSWYDVPAYSHPYATSSKSFGEDALEFLEGIGIVCRPRLVWQDTDRDDYTLGDGTWESLEPGTGAHRSKKRLRQLDTTAGLQWAAEGPRLPLNPAVAFSFGFVETPPDWDTDTLPPYVRIEFGAWQGQPQWALEFSKTAGSRLLAWDNSLGWVMVLSLPEPQTLADSDLGEALVVLRCHRGRIGVSVDGGHHYDWFGNGVGTALTATVRASGFILRGQGGQLIFGLQQLVFVAGTYTSPRRNTFTSRGTVIPVSPVLTKRDYRPAGTSIALNDASDSQAGIARYTATLTPHVSGLTPFPFYTSPELYAVLFQYSPEVQWFSGLGFSTQPFDGDEGYLESIDISKPVEHDAATASVTVCRNGTTPFSWASGRWPKVQIDLGHTDTAGVMNFTTAFTGYVRQPSIAAEQWNEQRLHLEIDNQSVFLKRKQWTDAGGGMDRFPLGGYTVNAALDAILWSEGLYDPSPLNPFGGRYRTWHVAGDNVLLPIGLAEDPFELPAIGETKWETMQRIASYASLEIVPLDDGTFISIPVDYVGPYVSKEFEFVPASDLTNLVRRADLTLECIETVTAVLVYGTDETGQRVMVYAVNTQAEINWSRADFSGLGRETYAEELAGTVTLGMCAARCRYLAFKLLPLKFEAQLSAMVDLTVSRTDQVRLTGAQVIGAADYDRWRVETLNHRYRADPSWSELGTSAGLRRLT